MPEKGEHAVVGPQRSVDSGAGEDHAVDAHTLSALVPGIHLDVDPELFGQAQNGDGKHGRRGEQDPAVSV